MRRGVPIEILRTATPRTHSGKGWSFPSGVRGLLKRECAGKSVLHLFGGRADFGVRLDIDPTTNPDFVGDAWLPPFARDAFDVVIMDPPYYGEFQSLNTQKRIALFRNAAWIAREAVYWFHPQYLAGDSRIHLERAWLVVCGRNCMVRALQKFRISANKYPPVQAFECGGPAMKYNRWLAQPGELFPGAAPAAFISFIEANTK